MKKKEDSLKCEKALSEWLELSMQVSFRSHFQYFRKMGLSHSQIMTLHMLHHKRECSVGNVSRMLSISNPAASQLLDQLVKQGFIERHEGRHDRRTKFHRLSKEGLSILKNSGSSGKSWYQLLIEELSEEELGTVTEALDIMNSKIKMFNIFSNNRCRYGDTDD